MFTKDEDCYHTASKYCACIEFHLDEGRRHGFNSSQLIHYTLEPNADAGEDKSVAPQKLTVAFSTADVVILGWQLETLANKLRDNNLAGVRLCSKRGGQPDNKNVLVASIKIRPIEKG